MLYVKGIYDSIFPIDEDILMFLHELVFILSLLYTFAY
jgi:hypothetical protein